MLHSHSVKRILAILLLGMLLFNWGGHRLLTDYLETQADQQLQAELDRDQYNEADLIRIKVNAPLPYGASTEQYERVNGQIEIKGISYTYVKRRFYRDSLELLCIPNTVKTGIQNARDEFFRLANDFIAGSASKKATGHHAHNAKFQVTDFTDDHLFAWQSKQADQMVNWHDGIFTAFKSQYTCRLEKPPQAVA